MATPRKKPEDKLKAGRPTEYRSEYCEMLVEHFKGGGSIESFGAKIGHATSSIYLWFEEHPEFSEARRRGEPHLHAFYENLGKTIASGQLRRLKSETPILGKNDKPVIDPETGKPLVKREYEPATPGQQTFGLMAKNMLKWRERHDVEIGGKDGGPINFSNMSKDQLDKKILELVEKAKKK